MSNEFDNLYSYITRDPDGGFFGKPPVETVPETPSQSTDNERQPGSQRHRAAAMVGVAISSLLIGMGVGVWSAESQADRDADDIAECLSDKTGDKVEINTHPEHGHPMIPEKYIGLYSDC